MLARPELVRQAALMATRGRHDRAREFFHTAERDFANAGIQLPPSYEAKLRLLEGFSPKTLNNGQEPFGTGSTHSRCGPRSRLPESAPSMASRRRTTGCPPTRRSPHPVLVIGFADDVVMPASSAPRWQTPFRMGGIWRLPIPAIWDFSNGRMRYRIGDPWFLRPRHRDPLKVME